MIRHLLCGMLCAALLLLPAAGRANPGDLDPTFGIGGKVTTGIGTDDYGYAVAIQADGKLVVAGETNNGINYDVALVRYNANGTLDATFGTGGKVTTAVGTSDEAAYALAIQADGKLAVAATPGNFAKCPSIICSLLGETIPSIPRISFLILSFFLFELYCPLRTS